ncbi:MAG TPA: helix-turn-helix domain-containing protein, partial [Candidatus Kapabacteria bacterium]|nr:helix-turn-helix domain-containing protein [Candidatus Kapabacteria bacterium]
WLMSNSGILRIDKKELNRFLDAGGGAGGAGMVDCNSFGIADGMKSAEFNNEFSRSSVLKTGNGEFRFMTKKGITIVNPKEIQIDNMPPPAVIETVLFNERPVSFRKWPGNKEVDTYKGITRFQFQFTAPTFLAPEKIKFKYRLETVDKKWVFLPSGNERVARYKDLSPGTYTFRVIAGNTAGVWGQTGDTVTFILKPFFYETLIFKIAVILILIASSSAGFYSYRKRLDRKKVKYKTSTLNPQYADECVKKLKRLMEVEKLYRQSDLSLHVLAEKMAVAHHVLSQVLNEKLNRNFSDYINTYRIEEAKKILTSSQREELKITAVAFDVGFNTMVAFYNAFKKYTGMTPSEYKKKINIAKPIFKS